MASAYKSVGDSVCRIFLNSFSSQTSFSQPLFSDANFDDELLRGTATVLSRCEDTSCLELANQIYRLISEKKSGIRNRAVEIGLISEKGC